MEILFKNIGVVWEMRKSKRTPKEHVTVEKLCSVFIKIHSNMSIFVVRDRRR